jgi:hypothetical protein
VVEAVTATATGTPESAGDALLGLARAELDEERDHRRNIEQKALSVITSSGALVALLFGLAAITTSATSFQVTGWERSLLILALAGFFAAGVVAIVATWPAQAGMAASELERHSKDASIWTRPSADAAAAIFGAIVGKLTQLSAVNDKKAKKLVLAMSLQLVGVACAAAAVGLVLAS